MGLSPAAGTTQNFTRSDVEFVSFGTRCAAWLYRPRGVAWPPVMVMAHGFAAERSFGLPPFAERFAAAGGPPSCSITARSGPATASPATWSVRGGTSRTGGPRWLAAGQMRDIDPGRIALWGTSFSGGHVLAVAAEDPGIAAVVSQVPFVDPVASARQLGISYGIRACVAGLRDWISATIFRRPYYVPVYGPPGTLACLASADAAEGIPRHSAAGFPVAKRLPGPLPARHAVLSPSLGGAKVRCPALVVVAEQDTLSPAWAVRRTAQAMPAATLLELPGGHFSLYQGPTLETVVAAEIDFLKKHLASPRAQP